MFGSIRNICICSIKRRNWEIRLICFGKLWFGGWSFYGRCESNFDNVCRGIVSSCRKNGSRVLTPNDLTNNKMCLPFPLTICDIPLKSFWFYLFLLKGREIVRCQILFESWEHSSHSWLFARPKMLSSTILVGKRISDIANKVISAYLFWTETEWLLSSWGPFLEGPEMFSHPENCSKISNLMIT